jgi:small subunit ribosomal protein S19e
MVTVYDTNPEKLIKQLAEELKKLDVVKAPEWANFAKTGRGKERPPIQKDWWYMRAASILRKIYSNGPLGVSKLRKKYSAKKNRGHKPDKVFIAGGNIIRKILQQLEKAELLKYVEKGVHKGRIVTPKGQKLLNQVAKGLPSEKKEEIKQPSLEKNVGEEKPKVEEKKEVPKVEVKEPLLKKDVHEKKEIKVEEKQPSLEKKEEQPKDNQEKKENGPESDKGGEVKGASN